MQLGWQEPLPAGRKETLSAPWESVGTDEAAASGLALSSHMPCHWGHLERASASVGGGGVTGLGMLKALFFLLTPELMGTETVSGKQTESPLLSHLLLSCVIPAFYL